MKLQAPADFAGIVTIEGGKEYQPDKNGMLVCENPAHEHVLRQHGFTTATGVLSAIASRGTETREEDEDEFDAMTKGELIEWLEGQDDFDDDDLPARPKLAELQRLARDHKAKQAG